MEALGINLGMLIVQILNFLIMFVILRKWAFLPIIATLEKRRETIAKGLEDARVAAEARANAEKEAEKIKAEAQAQATQIVREATERAESAAKDIKAAADKEAAGAKDAAMADVEQERVRVLSDVRNQVAALAIAATQKLVGETLDEKRQRALIDGFFSGVKAGKVTIAEGVAAGAAAAEVTSALPLTAAEQETVKKEVGAATVTFRVDPAILGGLVIRVGDKVLDGSVAGKMSSLADSMR